MTKFRFLHAADLHLDSPLIGLSCKSAEFATRIDTASREAFDNLIALAMRKSAASWCSQATSSTARCGISRFALYFMNGMRRLGEHGIDVFVILGNHDAANKFAAKLQFADNVQLFEKDRSETKRLEDVRVALHGRSFPQSDFGENMARIYPAAISGWFNIGVLHTACAGNEGEHARYAPCSLEQLVNHGYEYWALGHVHGHVVLSETPHVVYPGNLQGRDPRETGAKGAVLVTVEDGAVVVVEHRALDVVRWATVTVEVEPCAGRSELRETLKESIRVGCAGAGIARSPCA